MTRRHGRSGPMRAAALVVLAAIAIAGCGGDGDDDAGGEDESIFDDDPTTTVAPEDTTTTTTAPPVVIDPCELVSKAEAEAVVGTGLDDPLPAPESCTYVGPPTGPTAQFEVFVGDGAFKFLEIDRDQLGHEFEPIPGVGDEALIEEGTSFVRVGDTWVALRVVLLEDFSVYKQKMIDLTTAVAARM